MLLPELPYLPYQAVIEHRFFIERFINGCFGPEQKISLRRNLFCRHIHKTPYLFIERNKILGTNKFFSKRINVRLQYGNLMDRAFLFVIEIPDVRK